jgi:hypothetical protein
VSRRFYQIPRARLKQRGVKVSGRRPRGRIALERVPQNAAEPVEIRRVVWN